MNLEDYKKLMADLKKQKEEFNNSLENTNAFNDIPISDNLKNDIVSSLNDLLHSFQSISGPLSQFKNVFFREENKDFSAFRNYVTSKPDLLNHSETEIQKLFELYFKAEEKDTNTSNRFCCLADSTCHETIIKAHSIQENGELDLIAGLVDNKKQVYHLSRTVEESVKAELKHISVASTFYGMCKDHDREIFKPIDTNTFENETQKMFLQSARAFFFSYYRTKVFQQRNLRYLQILVNSFSLDNEQLQVVRFEKHKVELEKRMKEGVNNLAFLKWSVPHICPIACSSWATIHLSMGENIITIADGTLRTGSPIIFSVLPSKATNSTTIVLARFKSDTLSKGIFNQFRSSCSSNEDYGRLISHIILRTNENFYLNPSFYDNLEENNKNKIQTLMNNKSPFYSGKDLDLAEQFNFFDSKFKIS